MPDATETVETPATPEPPAGGFANVSEAIAWRQANQPASSLNETVEPEAAPAAPSSLTDDVLAELGLADEPEVHDEEEAPAAPAATADDPFASFGGQQRVQDAVALADAFKTEAGARLVVAQALTALGYDPANVKAALEGQGATPQQAATAAAAAATEQQPDPLAALAALDDDDVVTAADVRKLVQALATQQAPAAPAEPASDPRLDAIETQLATERQRVATATTDATLVELLGEPPADPAEQRAWSTNAQAVLAYAANEHDPANWDPIAIRQAIIRGHGAWRAIEDQRLRAYVASKRAAKANTPTHTGGTQVPGGDATPAEPRNAKEATAMLKEQGFFAR